MVRHWRLGVYFDWSVRLGSTGMWIHFSEDGRRMSQRILR